MVQAQASKHSCLRSMRFFEPTFSIVVSRTALTIGCICAAIGIAGCAIATAPNAEKTKTGALFSVRLEKRFEVPASVSLEVTDVNGAGSVTISGKLARSFPSAYADYLIAAALTPGQYKLTRISFLEESEVIQQPLAAQFSVPAGPPTYMGRLIIRVKTESGLPVAIDDQYEEDTVMFKSALPELKELLIGKVLLDVSAYTEPLSKNVTSQKKTLEFSSITPLAEENIPDRAKKAFSNFIRLKSPKAFAISKSGVTGTASGKGSVEKAVKNCERLARNDECTIFAVDDTLLDGSTATGPTRKLLNAR